VRRAVRPALRHPFRVSLLAVDLGTSRIKVVRADAAGALDGVHAAPTPVDAAPGLRHAFPAETVRSVAETLIGEAAAGASAPVRTIVLSCLGTAAVPVDAAGAPLGDALSPADPRPLAGPGLVERTGIAAPDLFRQTGSDAHLASTLLHWLWWREAEPAGAARLHRLRSLRGYLLAALAGADAEDPSWASRTMAMDLESDAWSASILGAAGLDDAALPPILPSTTSWPILPAVIRRLGLAPDARIVLGGMDNACALLGAAAPGEERLVNIAGTYEHMAGVGPLATCRTAATAVGGLVHRWLLPGTFLAYSRVPVGLLLGAIGAASPDGIEPLLRSLPEQPAGRSAPLDEHALRAALAAGSDPAGLLAGVMESGAEVLARFTEAWTASGARVDRIVVVGGGAGQERSLRLKAALLGRPVWTLASDEAAAIGALRLALHATEAIPLADAGARVADPLAHAWSPAS